jgi:hypothetical protein
MHFCVRIVLGHGGDYDDDGDVDDDDDDDDDAGRGWNSRRPTPDRSPVNSVAVAAATTPCS